MGALERLLLAIRLRWGIQPDRVLGHGDVSPGRKIDPGEKFDWRRLALSGHAIWSDLDGSGCAADEGAVLDAARRLGYRAPEDGGEAAVIAALQMRFAPQETGGPVSARLTARALDLAARHPVEKEPRPAPGV